MVVAPDAAVATWAAERIELGLGLGSIQPLVLGPAVVPVVTDPAEAEKEIELAILSAMAHGNGPRGLAVVQGALGALGRLDFIPTGPAGAGGVGDQPPKQPQDASDSSPKCNEDDEETVRIVDCSLRVDWPHESMHFPGTINVEATVQCDAPVAGIELKVGLARDGQEVASSTFANSGVASLEGRAATTLPCVSGAYTGGAAALVTFSSPSLATRNILNANSITRPIICKK